MSYPAADHASMQAVMERYLADHGERLPAWCAIGIANPVVGDLVQMTNHHWAFSIADVQRAFGFRRFLVINDFTALALALPALEPRDLHAVGGGVAVPNAPVGLIGPGTGLGVSGLLPGVDGRASIAINGEGGHVTLAPMDLLEEEVIHALRQRFGHASAERALSGPGLENLYRAVCEVEDVAPRPLAAPQITAAGVTGDDAQCARVLEIFCSLLGNVAGNLALTLGARGGVYIGGGIVPRLGTYFESSAFRSRFEDKGRFRGYLENIPVYVLTAGAPALVGAARALDDLVV